MTRILIIDDDPDLRESLGAILVDAGFDVSSADNGKSGVDSFRVASPDLVILDLFMPEKEGIETLRELRAIEPKVKVFAMSGGGTRARADLLPIAKTLGAMRTFRKPVDVSELLEAVRGALTAGQNV